MKAISAIIAIILILMIVVALAALSYTWFTGIFTSTTETAEESITKTTTGMLANMKIESASNSNIYVRNTGQTDISDLSVYVDDEPVEVTMDPPTIEPGDVGTVSVKEYIGKENVNVKITTAQGSVTITEELEEMTFCDDPNVVLCLTFDEGTGTTAYDSSPYGNNGTLYNGFTSCYNNNCPMWVDGKHGKALKFDGNGDWVGVSHSESLNFGTDDFTIEAWLKAEVGSAAAVPGPISKYDEELYMTGWHLYIAPDRLLYFYAWDWNIGIADVIVTSKDSFDDGVLHHVAVVRNSTTVRMLVDGDEVGVGDTGVLINVDSIGNLTIGSIGSVGNFWSGVIDEVKIYNKALI